METARPGKQFYSEELGLNRLHRIMNWLWLCGQTVPPRPLHHQLLMGRTIVITEHLDCHLVWGRGRIFLKPLPRWLIHRDFWENHLDQPAPTSHGSIRTVRGAALGFLLSYIALIQYESDFYIAKEARVISPEFTWKKWKTLVQEVLGPDRQLRSQVADRFIYGELRLHRLDLIYQCLGLSLRGYIPRWSSYRSFIQDNLDIVVAGTVYLALVLSAMQLGLSTTNLEGNMSFQAVSYGAAILAILGPLVAVALILLLSILNFLQNWAWNRRNEKKAEKILGRRWR